MTGRQVCFHRVCKARVAAGWTTEQLWFDSRQEQENNFLFCKASPSLLAVSTGGLYYGEGSKRPGREADHSLFYM